MFERLRRLVGRRRVGVYVDGPNVFRSEFDVDLDDVRTTGRSLGSLAVARVYLNERAPASLIQAAESRGFEVVVTSSDVDVKLAVDATEAICDGTFDVLAIASRDVDFKPVLETAARRGIETVAVTPGEHGRSDGLVNAANRSISLEE